MRSKHWNVRKQGKILENSFYAPCFQRNHGKLSITEKLVKYRRRVFKVSFFPASLVSMLSFTRQSFSFHPFKSFWYLDKQRIVLFNSNICSRHCKRFTNNSDITMRIIPSFVFQAHVICDENVQTPVHENQYGYMFIVVWWIVRRQ